MTVREAGAAQQPNPPDRDSRDDVCRHCGDTLIAGKPFCAGCGRRAARANSGNARRSAGGGLVAALFVVGGGLVAIAVALGVLGGGAALKSDFMSIGRSVGPSCTFGVTGTAASVTFKGWPAATSCGDPNLGVALYHAYAESLTTPVICQYNMGNLRATVRDEGVLKLVGNVMCQALRRKAS